MLYEQGQCYPKNKGYKYKLYLKTRTWISKVYHKNKLIGIDTIAMTYEPRYGIDVLDSNLIDKGITNIINKHRKS